MRSRRFNARPMTLRLHPTVPIVPGDVDPDAFGDVAADRCCRCCLRGRRSTCRWPRCPRSRPARSDRGGRRVVGPTQLPCTTLLRVPVPRTATPSRKLPPMTLPPPLYRRCCSARLPPPTRHAWRCPFRCCRGVDADVAAEDVVLGDALPVITTPAMLLMITRPCPGSSPPIVLPEAWPRQRSSPALKFFSSSPRIGVVVGR